MNHLPFGCNSGIHVVYFANGIALCVSISHIPAYPEQA